MSFVLDTNFIITLREIGQLPSLLSLKKVIVPKIIKKEAKVDDFDNLLDVQANIFSVVEVPDHEKSNLIMELAQKLRVASIQFCVELDEQAGSISLPDGWKCVTNMFLLNDGIKALKNVYTNASINEWAKVRKSEKTKVIEHPDTHICALAFRHRKYYILSMDACIWATLNLVHPNFKNRIVSIFRYLKMVFKDQPKIFIETLTKVIEKRFSFAKDLIGSTASVICHDHLEESVDEVFARYVADVIFKVSYTTKKDSILELFRLKGKIRDVVKKHTSVNETLTFRESEFIKELKEIGQALITVEQSLD